jgi:molybdate transport system ATP-binding protein
VSLDARLSARLGPHAFELAFAIEARGTLALVGESGAGKTTALRLLAGLLRPTAGRLEVAGEVWFDAAAGIERPACERSVGWVPQDWALFPHLDARANVAFGLRASGLGRRDADARADAALARVGMADLAARHPRELSGGQQQRVALARALVLEPALLLLDEPLSALDLRTRQSVRGELKRLLATLPCVTVYVTHSAVEALVFGDRIAVLEDGTIRQQGAADELVRRPRTPYVAELMGVNLLRGTLRPGDGDGLGHLDTGGGDIAVVDDGPAGEVFGVVDPRDITLSREAPAGSARNVVRGRIAELVPEPPLGERLRVVIEGRPPLVAEITRQAAERMGLAEGVEVHATFKATGVTVYR